MSRLVRRLGTLSFASRSFSAESTLSGSAEAPTSTTPAPCSPADLSRMSNTDDRQEGGSKRYARGENPKLRYIKPYWWPYRTFVKQRWIGRELLEVVSTEFRDRSVDYYRHALESGVTRVNGHVASPTLILRNGDRIENTTHRHEPPVTNDAVQVLHIDKEREFIVIHKPGSMPIHATGRYWRNTVLEILKEDHNIKAYSVNRLDRLTSGCMIMATSSKAANRLAIEFRTRNIQKEYVARVKGKFPEGNIDCRERLLTADRQMGLVIVAPEGKDARTVFRRLSYDVKRDESVVHCRPMTGRTHQIRVHLQYLGHPIANDPLYSPPAVWGPNLGKGGLELAPQPAPPSTETGTDLDGSSVLQEATPTSNPLRRVISDSDRLNGYEAAPAHGASRYSRDELEGIERGAPILLSQEAKEVVARLRRMRDEAEDWVKWKEVIWNAQKAKEYYDDLADEAPTVGEAGRTPLSEVNGADLTPAPASGPAPAPAPESDQFASDLTRAASPPGSRASRQKSKPPTHPRRIGQPSPPPSPAQMSAYVSPLRQPAYLPPGFCPDCFIPLPEDPDPEKLFIFLHALRYTTPSLGMWGTPLPRWAEGRVREWDGEWRGWAGEGEEVPPVFEVEDDTAGDALDEAGQDSDT